MNRINPNPCQFFGAPQDLYPNWSEDIWAASSSDNGSTWTALENITHTPRDPDNSGINNCAPEEQYVHTSHWSTDGDVFIMYQQPDWSFNEVGDPLGVDHKNRIFAGSMEMLPCGCCGIEQGDVNWDYALDILDLVGIANHILNDNLEGCGLDAADVNEDGFVNILDIVVLVNMILEN